MMARLQRPDVCADAEEIADEILEMRRQFGHKVRLILVRYRLGIAAPRQQPIVQRNVRRGEMSDESGVDPGEPVAAVEILEGDAILESEFCHFVSISKL